ncbi:hypothetical protein RUM44_013743 [Polyplax serrata]|uniref:Uncharacterized protein n=1 Tax=Polyplax serrata TaxID=468196 RepID=A0ABR1BJ91_POLSC
MADRPVWQPPSLSQATPNEYFDLLTCKRTQRDKTTKERHQRTLLEPAPSVGIAPCAHVRGALQVLWPAKTHFPGPSRDRQLLGRWEVVGSQRLMTDWTPGYLPFYPSVWQTTP